MLAFAEGAKSRPGMPIEPLGHGDEADRNPSPGRVNSWVLVSTDNRLVRVDPQRGHLMHSENVAILHSLLSTAQY